MKYLILITANPAIDAHFAALPDDERKREFQLYWDIESDLDASGELVDSKAVDAASQQLVTRGPDGAVTSATSDAETVSGYYLVDVADAARAAEIAARFPEAAVSGGGVRVTRVWTQEDFDATT